MSRGIGQIRHSLFVLDSCFSGLAGLELKSPELSNVYMKDLLKSGHFLMTAGTAGQESYASLEQWGRSHFTDVFIRGASGAADAGKRRVSARRGLSVTKFYSYIRDRVAAGRRRLPQIDQAPCF